MRPREVELVEAVRDLARKKFVERAAGYDRERRFPRENVDELVRWASTRSSFPRRRAVSAWGRRRWCA